MKFTISGSLDGLNVYTDTNRNNRYAGNAMKQRNQKRVIQAIRASKLPKVTKYPFKLSIAWYEPDMRRDYDNIVFAKKFILDALVKSEIIIDDSRKYINQGCSIVLLDRKKPRIEVELIESDE